MLQMSMPIIYYPLHSNKSRNNWLDWFDSLLGTFEFLQTNVLEMCVLMQYWMC